MMIAAQFSLAKVGAGLVSRAISIATCAVAAAACAVAAATANACLCSFTTMGSTFAHVSAFGFVSAWLELNLRNSHLRFSLFCRKLKTVRNFAQGVDHKTE